MATQLQMRRGTTSQVAAFTGANGEVVVDTEKKTLFVNDGSTAGGLEIARADFSNISGSAALTLATLNATTVNTTSIDLTNLEVTNIKAKDGTSAGSIADSTGVVTIASAVLTTADINAGTVDAVIGGTTPAAGSFTTLSASTSITGTLATAAQANITSVGTLTGFTSTGIDDNAASTTITITSDNFVGLGTASPDDNSFGAGNGILAVASSTGSAKTAMINLMGDGNDTDATRVASIFFNDQSATGAGKTLAGVEAYRASAHATDPGGKLLFSTNASGGSYTTAMTIDSSQRVLINTTASRITSGVTPNFVIEGTSYNTNSAALFTNANGVAECPVLFFGKSRGTSVGSNTIVQNGDRLFTMRIDGSDGTNLEQAAIIEAYVDAAPAANSIPGRLTFMTTNSGSQYATEKMRLDSTGVLQLKAGPTSYAAGSSENSFVYHDNSGNTSLRLGSNYAVAGSATHIMNRTTTLASFWGSGYAGLVGATDVRFTLSSNGTEGDNSANWVRGNSEGLSFNSLTGGEFKWEIGGGEKMVLDANGVVCIGDGSPENGAYAATTRLYLEGAESVQMIKNTSASDASNRVAIGFLNSSGTAVGNISNDSSSTAYTESSDHRLKENVIYDWDALTRLKQLKPARFNFKTQKDNTVDGFLAHEVQTVVPKAITGTHNETKDLTNVVLNEHGNVIAEGVTEDDWKAGKEGEEPIYAANTTWKAEHTQDVYQGIDQSKLVPLMVKAIQEQQTQIEALQTEVAALKGE